MALSVEKIYVPFQEYVDENQSEFYLFKIKRNSVKNSLLLIEAEFFFDKFFLEFHREKQMSLLLKEHIFSRIFSSKSVGIPCV